MFITEGLLTTLMCAPRSVYSWDVVLTRAGGKLFFDRRDGSAVELLTAAETAPEVRADHSVLGRVTECMYLQAMNGSCPTPFKP